VELCDVATSSSTSLRFATPRVTSLRVPVVPVRPDGDLATERRTAPRITTVEAAAGTDDPGKAPAGCAEPAAVPEAAVPEAAVPELAPSTEGGGTARTSTFSPGSSPRSESGLTGMLTGRTGGAGGSSMDDSISSPGWIGLASVLPTSDSSALKALPEMLAGREIASLESSEASMTLPAGMERLAITYCRVAGFVPERTEAKATTPAAQIKKPPSTALALRRRVRPRAMTPAAGSLGNGPDGRLGESRRGRSSERPGHRRRREASAGNHRTGYEIYREATFLSSSEITFDV